MRIFITFGQTHVHRIHGKTFDCDCIGVINCNSWKEGRDYAMEIFNKQFCFSLTEKEFYSKGEDFMHYFPRGLIEVN